MRQHVPAVFLCGRKQGPSDPQVAYHAQVAFQPEIPICNLILKAGIMVSEACFLRLAGTALRSTNSSKERNE